MLQRTVSLWRRVTGQTAGPSALEEADRRLWVRYPSNVQTYYEPTNGTFGEGRLSARIRDISRAGIQLLVDLPFEPGHLLTVELPSHDESRRTVLACVVYVREVEEGRWALGCSFARELDAGDLAAFQDPGAAEPHRDNRHWQRYPCNIKATCQVVSPSVGPKWPATVLNVSTNGMALQVLHDVPTGTLLAAELAGGATHQATTILACVVHVLTQTSGERVLGCSFIRELSEADLASLV